MLDNCTYNKVKLLHELCSLSWFIDKCAISDAKSACNSGCEETLEDIKKNLQDQIKNLQKIMAVCNCAK